MKKVSKCTKPTKIRIIDLADRLDILEEKMYLLNNTVDMLDSRLICESEKLERYLDAKFNKVFILLNYLSRSKDQWDDEMFPSPESFRQAFTRVQSLRK